MNGRSILFDAAAREIEFYHIELAEHEVLIAEGAPAESYRDDGNRLLFDNPDPPRFAAANMPSYAPVLTGGPEVEALWRRLLERSGFVPPEASADPGLHLIADGRRIDPEPLETRPHGFQGIYRFRLEQAPLELAIVSRSTVPAAMGLNHDARRLGVALRSISLRGAGCAIDLDYDSPWLDDGFHRPEHSARHRWTNGHAPLPRDCHRLFDGEIEVLLEIVCTARYPLADQLAEAVLPAAA